jgi:hypothetical protein
MAAEERKILNNYLKSLPIYRYVYSPQSYTERERERQREREKERERLS